MKKYGLKLLGATLVFGLAWTIFKHIVPIHETTLIKEWLGMAVLLGGSHIFWSIMK